ncbi:TPA: polysaccharide pyruvyl transferase family protein [Streptococcus suis]|nr:polysaccharide pyruvyl transferase family protein [Streptococcus suis]
MTKYALFNYSTVNVGDEIQSLAAKRFLPRVDYYINRDFINDFHPESDEEIKLIMNGWYSHRPENFPIKLPQIKPLLVSMYFADYVKDAFSTAENIAYFKQHGPVGGRSQDSTDFLHSLGVDSYHSACLTLTLQKDETIPKRNFVLAVDVPEEVYQKLVTLTDSPIIRLHPAANHLYMSIDRRMKLAKYYLYLYQSAKFVITTRLHATLPSLALETDVLMLEKPGFEDSRFKSLRELAHHMTIQEFLESGYNIEQPPKNPTTYLTYLKQLEDTCRAFTGYQSNRGFLDGQDIVEFLHDPDLLQNITTGLHAANQLYGL